MSNEKNLMDYFTRKMSDVFINKYNDDSVKTIMDIKVERNEIEEKEIHIIVDAEYLLDTVVKNLTQELKKNGIAYPVLKAYVAEKGKMYQLEKYSINRAGDYKSEKE